MQNKKAFTLIEILVSISLFMIIILFLYQALDMTQKSNNFFASKLEKRETEDYIKKILFLDMISKNNKITNNNIITNKDKNSILLFTTSTIYHNPFYTNVTYMLSKNGDFLRIESKDRFNIKDLRDNFFDDAYIDILDKNITKLKMKVQKNKQIVIYIEYKDGRKILFTP